MNASIRKFDLREIELALAKCKKYSIHQGDPDDKNDHHDHHGDDNNECVSPRSD